MRRNDFSQLFAYGAVGVVSVGLAFMASTKFLGRTHAQATALPAPSEASLAPSEALRSAVVGAPSTPAVAPPATSGNPTNPADSTAPIANPSAGLAELEGFLEPFIYDVNNRRDPFAPFAEYAPSDDPASQRPLSLAQRFDLDQLKLIGIMWDVREPRAMFADPENSVMILGRDESIGNRNGYIAAIREGEVVVVEATNRKGDVLYRTRVLRIQR